MLARLLLIVQSVLVLAALVCASDKTYRLRGAIVANNVLGDVSELATRASAVVNGGEHRGYIQKDGSFVVENLTLGDWLLEIQSADYAFPKLHVRIATNDEGRASVAARYVQIGSEWSEDAPVLAYPLKIEASAKYDFFTPRQGFSIITMFSNPYMLMVGASLAAIFIMPKLQANLDPEALKELQEK
ncbi:hypothetical protein GGH12_002973 [Coemansia sp. RSA 1822]|nr:hypothetical protein LPJ76_001389 [Coemansia sp. RSA 638]KAJ2121399.1 hypothetical protein IW147_004286 [Coemansia sp. RSA 720]KAJ2477166.1 hypothetical protein IWW56_004502 [Coemansia sp. RSA 2131]KAJ2543801.1 hypothetical protein GGF49_001760 [Coemansia sp. RSA 1853]KAJ2562815.1 hypothetical protein GGH12_002973 [Coemansia sp. RSA 1822]